MLTLTVEEVYIRGKYPDLGHVLKIARAEAKRLFKTKDKVLVTEIEQTGSGYLVKSSLRAARLP